MNIYSFILKLKFKSWCVWFLMLNTTNIYLIPALATYVRTVSAAWGNQICAHNQCQCVDLQTDVPSYTISWSRFFDVCHISLSWYQGKIHLYYNLLILFYTLYKLIENKIKISSIVLFLFNKGVSNWRSRSRLRWSISKNEKYRKLNSRKLFLASKWREVK